MLRKFLVARLALIRYVAVRIVVRFLVAVVVGIVAGVVLVVVECLLKVLVVVTSPRGCLWKLTLMMTWKELGPVTKETHALEIH